MKKKIFAILLTFTMLAAFCACGSGAADENTSADAPAGEEVTLYLSAAASMTESMNKAIAAYEAANPGVKIQATFDSSGTLKTQIVSGADCDVFLSAAQKQMNQLDGASDQCEGENYVLEGTRKDILENKCALVTAENSEIASWVE